MNEFKNGKLTLDLSDRKQKNAAIYLAFALGNAGAKIYNDALKLVPNIKGLGIKRKTKMVFDIIELVKNNKQTEKVNQKLFDKAFDKSKNNPIYAKADAYNCSTSDFYDLVGVEGIDNKKTLKKK